MRKWILGLIMDMGSPIHSAANNHHRDPALWMTSRSPGTLSEPHATVHTAVTKPLRGALS